MPAWEFVLELSFMGVGAVMNTFLLLSVVTFRELRESIVNILIALVGASNILILGSILWMNFKMGYSDDLHCIAAITTLIWASGCAMYLRAIVCYDRYVFITDALRYYQRMTNTRVTRLSLSVVIFTASICAGQYLVMANGVTWKDVISLFHGAHSYNPHVFNESGDYDLLPKRDQVDGRLQEDVEKTFDQNELPPKVEEHITRDLDPLNLRVAVNAKKKVVTRELHPKIHENIKKRAMAKELHPKVTTSVGPKSVARQLNTILILAIKALQTNTMMNENKENKKEYKEEKGENKTENNFNDYLKKILIENKRYDVGKDNKNYHIDSKREHSLKNLPDATLFSDNHGLLNVLLKTGDRFIKVLIPNMSGSKHEWKFARENISAWNKTVVKYCVPVSLRRGNDPNKLTTLLYTQRTFPSTLVLIINTASNRSEQLKDLPVLNSERRGEHANKQKLFCYQIRFFLRNSFSEKSDALFLRFNLEHTRFRRDSHAFGDMVKLGVISPSKHAVQHRIFGGEITDDETLEYLEHFEYDDRNGYLFLFSEKYCKDHIKTVSSILFCFVPMIIVPACFILFFHIHVLRWALKVIKMTKKKEIRLQNILLNGRSSSMDSEMQYYTMRGGRGNVRRTLGNLLFPESQKRFNFWKNKSSITLSSSHNVHTHLRQSRTDFEDTPYGAKSDISVSRGKSFSVETNNPPPSPIMEVPLLQCDAIEPRRNSKGRQISFCVDPKDTLVAFIERLNLDSGVDASRIFHSAETVVELINVEGKGMASGVDIEDVDVIFQDVNSTCVIYSENTKIYRPINLDDGLPRYAARGSSRTHANLEENVTKHWIHCAELKVILPTLFILIVHVFTWFGLFITIVLKVAGVHLFHFPAYQVTTWVAFLTMCVDPTIYIVLNRPFRRAVLRRICHAWRSRTPSGTL